MCVEGRGHSFGELGETLLMELGDVHGDRRRWISVIGY